MTVNTDESTPVWDEEKQSWIRKWNADYPLAGVAVMLFNLEMWFGDDSGKALTIHYPIPEGEKQPFFMLNLLANFEEMNAFAITSSGLRISMILPGWAKIKPGHVEIRP